MQSPFLYVGLDVPVWLKYKECAIRILHYRGYFERFRKVFMVKMPWERARVNGGIKSKWKWLGLKYTDTFNPSVPCQQCPELFGAVTKACSRVTE